MAAADVKPTLLFVGGAWHYPASYAKFTTALRAAGLDVHVPRLTTMNGARPPNRDLYTDSELIRTYAESLADSGRDISVLLHSYGGQVGTNALHGLSKTARAKNGLPGGITRIIYMCAFASPKGRSMNDLVTAKGHAEKMDIAFNFDKDDRTCVPNYIAEGLVGGVEIPSKVPEGAEQVPFRSYQVEQLDPAELEEYKASLARWPGHSFDQAITETPAWSDDGLKLYYIFTLGDATVPVDYQQTMVADAEEANGRKFDGTIELETGHSPNLTKTKEVVEAIVKWMAE